MDDLTRAWPLFGLRLRVGELELRLPTDRELVALADLAAQGIHGPEVEPFPDPWPRRRPPELHREFLRFHWSTRVGWAPEDWRLELGVWSAGELVGTQGIAAQQFAVRRVVSTGSWLGLRHHGRGIGTAMRTAVLALGFEGLGARRAETGAVGGNAASLAVTRKLGYQPDGERVLAVDGAPVRQLDFAMSVDQWRAVPRPAVAIEGLEPCRPLLGAR